MVALGFAPQEGRGTYRHYALGWSIEQRLIGKSGHVFNIHWPDERRLDRRDARDRWWREYAEELTALAEYSEEVDALKSVLDFCP